MLVRAAAAVGQRRCWRPATSLRRAASHAADSGSPPPPFNFDSLVATPAPTSTVALRLQRYFAMQDLNATSPTLRTQAVHSVEFAHKLQPLLQWAFRSLRVPDSSSDEAPESAEAAVRDPVRDVFMLLTPWTNAARDKAWRGFFMRQFFLSGAPLPALLAVLDLHDAIAPARVSERTAAFLASEILQEYCARGRFDEAIDAYTQLPLLDRGRRDVAEIMHDHEQYESVVQLYSTHRALDPPAAPLDPLRLLSALRELNRRDELNREFESLSPQDQSRADIQELMG
ncbi:hypothetical protein PybrP1_011319 [[Pythium] brassicae (nom. inval.)]|nr:hypothetical protein PybrP1_011319 [[Pythium] brassicae (nom. inval.)]